MNRLSSHRGLRNRMAIALAAAAFAGALAGCTSPMVVKERKSLLSDLTDCAPDEIQARRGRRGTWTATCQGVTYQCSGDPDTVCEVAPPPAR